MKEKKEGKCGTSGYTVHLDYSGYERIIGYKENYPEWLISIIKFRNENLHKEWCSSMEHEIRGTYPESNTEINRKVKEMSDRVSRRFDELKKIYGKLDDAIDEAIKFIE